MDELDPEDPRPPYQQVANALRAAILTRKLRPGEKLPSGSELSRRYQVARMTVQHAIRLLREEGLVVSRQGSGVFVRERTERAVGLRPHIERAFEQPKVTIDFAGFSGETLHGAIQEPIDKIRLGRLRPEEITIRVLVPDLSVPSGLPALASTGKDDPAVRARSEQITRRSTQAIVETVHELADLELVKSASTQVRVYWATPLFKLYILNNEEAFFGFYPVVEHDVMVGGERTGVFDAMGKDAILFHHDSNDELTSLGGQYVQQAALWFDSVWNTIARDFNP